MWTRIAHFILKYRLLLIIVIALITGVMGYFGTKVSMAFQLAELVPRTNPEMKYYIDFKETFGEDANVMVVGFESEELFKVGKIKAYKELCDSIQAIEGVEKHGVLALPTLQYMRGKGQIRRRSFDIVPVFDSAFYAKDFTNPSVDLKAEFDAKLKLASSLKIYDSLVFNRSENLNCMLVTLKEEYVNSKRRQAIVKKIDRLVASFAENEELGEAHIAGLPYVRTVMSGEVAKELNNFLILSLVATALILLFFFRSIQSMVFPLIVIGVAVVWTVGTLGLLHHYSGNGGFQITLLTGLIPPIIVVIGIPNCVYLLNKYHHEYLKSENKILALSKVIRKIGIVTLITNCTTAVGFLVLTFADITILKEFGIVAGINVFSTFFISVILIPAVFSYLPAPSTKQLKHLEFKMLNGLLNWLENTVHNHRKWVFATTIVLVAVCGWGSWKVHALSFMVDDIPAESKVKKDLRFFETHLGGVMPLELVIHLESVDDIKDLDKMQKIAQLEDHLSKEELVGKPVSVLTFVRAANQSYWYDNAVFFALPSPREQLNFGKFLERSAGDDVNSFKNNSFVDSAQALLRISLKVSDIGSKKMDSLISRVIAPAADSILGVEHPYDFYQGHEGFREAPYRITGTTPLFIKGNKYLIHNLRQSLLIAIVLISIIMAALFRNIRMIILSLIPNLVPLAITGALMGYFGIPLKPSTALIFSIAFGISVDDSIHFLAKYRQELFANGFNVKVAVSNSIRETGSSMIYTSIVLFFGFIIFTASNFQGTQMLGLLTSTTLFCAMITNLILLPALLLQFDSGKRKVGGAKPFIDTYNDAQKDLEESEEATQK